jgi:hypothetical protein
LSRDESTGSGNKDIDPELGEKKDEKRAQVSTGSVLLLGKVLAVLGS